MRSYRLLPWLLIAAIGLIVVGWAAPSLAMGTQGTKAPTKWVQKVPSDVCPNATHTNCHVSSPAVADLNGDQNPDVVVATNSGVVVALRHDGVEMWRLDVAPWFGMAAGTQEFTSSPAVADIDQDGKPEIVVGTGTRYTNQCTQGGIVVIEDNGSMKSGWPFLTQDGVVPPSGCRDSVFSTPALGDLDQDGDLEIVVGSFDKRIYALHHNGGLVAGFPVDSNHFDRFGWQNLQNSLGDTIWSSPALADINGDGYLDIVIGTDEGNYDNRWEPGVGWNCTYTPPSTPGYCGGSIYVVDRFGESLPGWPRYELEIIQSSPAVADVDGDGKAEIFVGTGSYYYENSPDRPTDGYRLFGIDDNGQDLPGWAGGKAVGGTTPASPVVGDITGDGQPNIVVTARDKKLYAWHLNGSAVSGFPMVPVTHAGQTLDGYNVPKSIVLADTTGDGVMEMVFTSAWDVVVVNGKGQQLTATSINDDRTYYGTNGTLSNSPAVADLDGNGRLDLIAANSEVFVWELPNSSLEAEWPMFKRTATRTSANIKPSITAEPEAISILHESGTRWTFEQTITLVPVGVGGPFTWQVESSEPTRLRVPDGGTSAGTAEFTLSVPMDPNMRLGTYRLGTLVVTAQANGEAIANSPITIPVDVTVLEELERTFLPMVQSQ